MDAAERAQLYQRYIDACDGMAEMYVASILKHVARLPVYRTQDLISITPPQVLFPDRRFYPEFAVLFPMVVRKLARKHGYVAEWNPKNPFKMFVRWVYRIDAAPTEQPELAAVKIDGEADADADAGAKVKSTPESRAKDYVPITTASDLKKGEWARRLEEFKKKNSN